MESRVNLEEKETFWDGVRACLPTVLGYLSIGFAAGVIGKTSGLSVLEICLMSLWIYAGSAQFITAGMLASQASAIAIVTTVFIVNLRHFLLSAALSPYFRHLSPLRNLWIGSLLTDETFGVASNQAEKKKVLSEAWMHGLNVTAYLNWLVANLIGAWLGQWIAKPEKWGLDFALPAMFIGLLVIQILSRKKMVKDVVVAISAVVLVFSMSMIFSESVGVIVATIFAATVGLVIEKWR